VLSTAARLQDAVQRTVLFEKAVAAGANHRAARYGAMLATRPPATMHNDIVRALANWQSNDQPRPAA
jgi:hypothetical protein